MERLTKWLDDKKALCYEVCEKECVNGYSVCHHCKPFADAMIKLAEYEDAEEQGMLLRLPCRVGDSLYIVGTKCLADQEPEDFDCDSVDCDKCPYDKEMIVFEREASSYLLYVLAFGNDERHIFGKTVFLTREEAEKALEEMG